MNKKNLIALSSSGLLVLGLGVCFLNPFFDVGVPGSYKDVKGSVNTINTVHAEQSDIFNEISNLESTVLNKTNELEDVKEVSEAATKSFTELLEHQKNSGDWGYHLPSILIELETIADNTGVTLAIDYDSLNSDGNYVSSSNKGLKVVETSVEVYGKYANVKEYIRNIENIDFLSVSNLILDRVEDGDTVGTYNLSIYYMD